MKKYLAVYIGKEAKMEQWEALDEKTRENREKEGLVAWHQWVKKNEKSILNVGAPLGVTKKVNERGISDTQNELTAFTVVQANSHEEAAKLFLDHPHFKIFPGDSIEVLECLEIPGM